MRKIPSWLKSAKRFPGEGKYGEIRTKKRGKLKLGEIDLREA